jgi:uncharacterized protein
MPPDAAFVSITRTPDELSIVCPEEQAPPGARSETGFRCFAVAGPLPFSATGILAALVAPLAKVGIPVFAIATFDTDYLLLREARVEEAAAALEGAGHVVGPRLEASASDRERLRVVALCHR